MKEDSFEEMLQYLCWTFAMNGQDNYPPLKEAAKCVSNVGTDDVEKNKEILKVEAVMHEEKYFSAATYITLVQNSGYDAKHLAEECRRRIMEEDDMQLEPLDWEWFDNPEWNPSKW